MSVVALILAIIVTIVYIKGFKGLFKSPTRITLEFNKTIEELNEKNGKDVTQISLLITTILYLLLVIFYYIVTASITGSLMMIVIASIMVVDNLASAWKLINFIADNGEFKTSGYDKLTQLAGIFYLISFYILFFS